jgi:nucleoid-associated protein YgaU
MATPGTKFRPATSRTALLSMVVALAAFAVVAYLWPKPHRTEFANLPPELLSGPATATAEPPPAIPAHKPANPAAPSFDVVRIGPRGDAVIAGRAAPGAEVVVRDGEVEIARVRADQQGNFVALPNLPLAPGGRELTLAARNGGGDEIKGDASVLFEVPATAPMQAGPGPSQGQAQVQAPVNVVLVPNAGAPRVLGDGARAAPGAPRLTLDTVDYDDAGAIRFTGASPAGGKLRLYVDNAAAGDVSADPSGRWSLTPAAPVTTGLHTVRVDQLDGRGKVVARLELPFQRSAMQSADLAAGRVVVQPGQNLWRIARLAYGRGMQYRVIYLANREQIRDPQRIYPGQTFAVPPT